MRKKFGNKLRNGYRAPDIGFHETSVRHRVPHGGKFGNKSRYGYRAPDVDFHETLVRNRVPHGGMRKKIDEEGETFRE